MGKTESKEEWFKHKFDSRSDDWIKQDRVAFGGLVGIGLIMIQPFLTAKDLDQSATICVIAFSISIPLLAALILLRHEESSHHRLSGSKTAVIGKGIGQLSAYIGLVAGFWHIHKIAGIAFIISSVVGMGIHSAGITKFYASDYAKYFRLKKS